MKISHSPLHSSALTQTARYDREINQMEARGCVIPLYLPISTVTSEQFYLPMGDTCRAWAMSMLLLIIIALLDCNEYDNMLNILGWTTAVPLR